MTPQPTATKHTNSSLCASYKDATAYHEQNTQLLPRPQTFSSAILLVLRVWCCFITFSNPLNVSMNQQRAHWQMPVALLSSRTIDRIHHHTTDSLLRHMTLQAPKDLDLFFSFRIHFQRPHLPSDTLSQLLGLVIVLQDLKYTNSLRGVGPGMRVLWYRECVAGWTTSSLRPYPLFPASIAEFGYEPRDRSYEGTFIPFDFILFSLFFSAAFVLC
ncbi:hypothetical protein GGS26DRAFT_428106 [Hypomontagnella submonticulosa]|nr:hypothetical protein GGS26DRAFT_428106 [Hypomontagnella submonticulosa]